MTTLQREAIHTLALPAGYTARPATLDDAPAVVAMLNHSSQALLGVDQHSLADTLAEWQSPGFQLSTNTQVVLAPSGEIVGYAYLWDMPPHVDPEQWGRVHPDHAGAAWAVTCWAGPKVGRAPCSARRPRAPA